VPNGGAQLSSEYFHPTNRSLKDYTQFPAVQKAFHEYLKTKLDVHANVDPTLFFNFFFSNSDTEVIKVLMNYLEDNKNTELTTITSKTHELKKSLDNCISSAFQRSKKEDIDLLLKSIPVKTLLTRSLFSQLQCTNNSEMQHYMIELGYTPTERERLMMENEQAFFNKIEEQFPVLKEYGKFSGQLLGPAHAERYGTIEAHQIFLEITRAVSY